MADAGLKQVKKTDAVTRRVSRKGVLSRGMRIRVHQNNFGAVRKLTSLKFQNIEKGADKNDPSFQSQSPIEPKQK
jgi:hypothetical protein